MTYCPICGTDPCELDELEGELRHVPYKIVDAAQLVAHKARVRSVIRRVEKSHARVGEGR